MRALAVEVSAEHSVHRIRQVEQGLQARGIGSHQRGVEGPLTFWKKTPIVEGHRILKLSGRRAATCSGPRDAEAFGRIGHVAFELIPVELLVTRFGALDVPGEGGADDRSR